MNTINRHIFKSIKWTGLVLVGFFIIAYLVIQLPVVQQYIINKITTYVSLRTKFNTKIEHVSIAWFDQAVLSEIYIEETISQPLIKAKKIKINFDLIRLLFNKPLSFDEARIDEAEVYIVKDSITRTFNINRFIDGFSDTSDTSANSSSGFVIHELELNNSLFVYDNQLHVTKKTAQEFDYNHFGFNDINADLSELRVIGDTFQIAINGMSCKEYRTNLPVHYLSTLFRLTPVSMEFDQLDFLVGKSHIRHFIGFYFNTLDDMDFFEEKVKITSHLTNTHLHTHDLARFAPEINRYQDRWKLSGNVNGTIQRLQFNDFDIQFGKRSSQLKGQIALTGLPYFNETFIQLSLTNSLFFSNDITPYIKDPDIKTIIQAFQKTTCKGQFIGFPQDFVAHADFRTQIGSIRSDVNVKLAEDSLKGTIITKDFNIGKLLGISAVGEVDGEGRLIGKGFALKDASYQLHATISKLQAHNYTYRSIYTKARLADQYFDGYLKISDPHLSFSAEGKIDFREGKDQLRLSARLDSAALDKLQITSPTQKIHLQTQMEVDVHGFKNFDVQGSIQLLNIHIRSAIKEAFLPSLVIESKLNQGWRSFHVYSDAVEVNALGHFSLYNVYRCFSDFIYEHVLALKNNDSVNTRYYENKRKQYKQVADFDMDYRILIKRINPFVDLFIDDFFISNRTILEGRFAKNTDLTFALNGYIDTLHIFKNEVYGLDIEVSSSKEETNSSITSNFIIFSKSQTLATIPATKNFQLEGYWSHNMLHVNSYIEEKNIENYAGISATVRLLDNHTQIRIDSSIIKLFEKKWFINPTGTLSFINNQFVSDNFSIHGENQFVKVEGSMKDQLKVTASNFDLSILNVLFTKDIEGKLHGQAVVAYRQPDDKLKIESTLRVDSLYIDSLAIGSMQAITHWNEVDNTIAIDLFIEKEQTKILHAKGSYELDNNLSPLNINLILDQTPLSVIQPFVKEVLGAVKGTANGLLEITGLISEPIITGSIRLSNMTCRVNYLNTIYTIADSHIRFSKKGIFFNKITIVDDARQTASFTGSLQYKYTDEKKWFLTLDGYTSRFKLLDKQSDESESFYGTVITTGTFTIRGYLDNIYIKSDITTNKGTKIYIPVNGSSNIEKKEFIRFVDKQANFTALKNAYRKKLNLTGIQMDLTLDVTSDALCEIIFDLRVGDIIRSYGDGAIKLKIDTKGEFSINGDYEIKKGDYKFTLASIINKEFKILSGSRISWYGDPYMANLAIKATYTQRLSYVPILGVSTDTKTDPSLRKPYPVIVELYLKGSLRSPQITYNIEFKDYPNQAANVPIQAKVVEFKARIASDEQELNRQVFSLIILKKLSPVNSFEVGQFSASQSVSELLSSQLSYLLSQYNENLEIDFDINDLTSESFATAQLTLSYSFLGGRLRVTRSGGVASNQTTTNVGNLVGDWTVEYNLTPSGKLKVKLFNRVNQNTIISTTNISGSNTTTAGTSLLHSQSFDSWKELFKRKNKKNKSPATSDAKREDELQLE